MRRPTLALLFAMAVLAAPALGHATPMANGSSNPDPWEAFNRRAYAFNMTLDRVLFRPVFKFLHLERGSVGEVLHNFLTNLSEPVVFFNDVLQVRPRPAARTAARFALNSTAGLVGVLDVANRAGLPFHGNGFGLTLGRYGVGSGPYLVLPFFGPSTVRDAIGMGADTVSSPLFWASYPAKTWASVGNTVLTGVDTRLQAGSDLDALISDAADPYATLRSTWLQMRQGEVDEARGVANPLPKFEDIPAAEIPAPPADAPRPEAQPPEKPQPPADDAVAPPPGPQAFYGSAALGFPDGAGEILLSSNHTDQAPAL